MEPFERSGHLIKGKWRIDARLGDGSTASVYAATHRNGYRVAVKILHSDLAGNADIRARFLREGYVANTIRHPGVVRILDDDVMEDGAVFLVMELLEGETLEARAMRFGGKLPLDDVIPTMDRLLDVLAAAHAQGIVHRDVKPDNVFLTKDGGLKVLDFGLARISETIGSRMPTRAGLILGTPDFMSPEQASGNSGAVDPRSDLWSVGATAFTLLTNEPVHKSGTLHEYLQVIASVPARSLSQAAPNVPRSVVEVIDRSLALDRSHRWGSAREMQAALREAYPLTAAQSLEVGVVIQRPATPTSVDRPAPSSVGFNRDITATEFAGVAAAIAPEESNEGEDPVSAAPTINESQFAAMREAQSRNVPLPPAAGLPAATQRFLQPPGSPQMQPLLQQHAQPYVHQPVMPGAATRDFSDFSSITTNRQFKPSEPWLPRLMILLMVLFLLGVVFVGVSLKNSALHRHAPPTSAPSSTTTKH